MTDELSVPKLTKLAETIGFEITEFTPGKCIVELTIREDHLNAGGVADRKSTRLNSSHDR